jgi:hypothetical protein
MPCYGFPAPLLQPVVAGSSVVCVAELESIEGRKAWLKALLLDRPDGTVLAQGRALFVLARPKE